MILVTGGAGFIGSHLAEALLARGLEVTVLDNLDDFYDPRMKKKNMEPCLGRKGYRFVEGDIRNEGLVQKLFSESRFSTVVHLAARPGVQPSFRFPALYADINVRGTVNLLQQSVASGVERLIFASSSSIYGNTPVIPFSETKSPPRPISPYGATKLAGEILAETYNRVHALSVTALRFFTVYGPRQRPDMAVAKFFRNILAGREIVLYGDGSARRDYTNIRDIVNGILRAVERCRGFHVYNLGRSETIPLTDLVSCIERAAGRKAVLEYEPARTGDPYATHADVSLAGAELDYAPRVSIEDGIREYAEWIRTSG
jgi:UDP-glucuronate 4-epimerase